MRPHPVNFQYHYSYIQYTSGYSTTMALLVIYFIFQRFTPRAHDVCFAPDHVLSFFFAPIPYAQLLKY